MPLRSKGPRGSFGYSLFSLSSLTSKLRGATSSSQAVISSGPKTDSLNCSPAGGSVQQCGNSQTSEQHGSPAVMPVSSVSVQVSTFQEVEHVPASYRGDHYLISGYCVEGLGGTAAGTNESTRTSQLPVRPEQSATPIPLVLFERVALDAGDPSLHCRGSHGGPPLALGKPLQTVHPHVSERGLAVVQDDGDLESGYYDRRMVSSSSKSMESLQSARSDSKSGSGLPSRWPRRAAAAGKLTGKRERPFEEKRRLLLNGSTSGSCFSGWGIGTTCRKGLKKGTANQDDFFVYCCEDWGLYGVFDGHGPGGHLVSNFVQWHLPGLIHDEVNADTSVPVALTNSFLRVNEMLQVASDEKKLDALSSGCTASVVLHRRQENKLFIAHVGDSRIVLATRNSEGQLIAERLTKEHRPDDPLERDRIERYGGEVRRPAGHIPHRVFVKGTNYPGLAMSRSMGDSLGHSAGITANPDVKERMLVEGVDEYIIMCSDGVWEFIGDQEAVDIVSQYPVDKVDKAVAELSTEAWKRWVNRDRYSVDDITAQVIHIFPSSRREDREDRDRLDIDGLDGERVDGDRRGRFKYDCVLEMHGQEST